MIVAVGALAVMVALGTAVLLAPFRTVTGQVIDAANGKPLAGVAVRAGDQEVKTNSDGIFTIPGIRFGGNIEAEAKGYTPSSSMVTMGDELRLGLSPRILEGVAIDTTAGKPVQGVQVTAGAQAVTTDAAGRFKLVGLEPGTEVAAVAEGFRGVMIKYEGQSSANLVLQPNVLKIAASNLFSGQPIEGADVTDGKTSARTDRSGQAQLQYVRDGAEVTVKLDGFSAAKVNYRDDKTVDVKLRPDTVTGFVKDSKGQPIAGAFVSDGKSTVTTDAAGAYKLTGVPDGAKLAVRASGFDGKQVEIGQQSSVEVNLGPFVARGLYLTYYGVGDDDLRGHVLELADKTEINTVVIDIKGDRGWLVYKSNVPMVEQAGAHQDVQIKAPKKFLADLRQRGVYTIARIVVFKDNPLATARPDLAVINSGNGQPWVDNEGLRWTDPTRQEVWDYNIALAVEAIQNGFDEVQFDYVRFPTDASAGNSLDAITFSEANTMANRTAAINGFLEKAKNAIHAAGGLVSADIFGYVVWRSDDMGIGQHLEDVAQHVDFVSPMVYPTLFWDGIELDGVVLYDQQQAGLYPYEIVSNTMQVAVRRIGAEKLRPWLQYYNDYLTGKSYGADEAEIQKKATYESGVTGWLFWDPSNRFNKGGFDPE